MKRGQGWARRVTTENLAQFKDFLRTPEQIAKEKANAAAKADRAKKRQSPFKGKPHEYPKRFTPGTRAKKAKKPTGGKAPQPKPQRATDERGSLLWRKKLGASDAQQTTGRTNPTGCLRFTKSPQYNSRDIDQTTFFRDELFAGFDWEQIKATPFEEATNVPFHFTINGEDHGTHTLRIQHKPSGEAGQHNYTTSLHWGELTPVIRANVRAGQILSLYGPPRREVEPFFVEIA